MNNNDFCNNDFEKKADDVTASDYKVYSKEYSTDGKQYYEHDRVYSSGENASAADSSSVKRRKKGMRESKRSAAIIAAVIALALICVASVVVSARVLSDYYELVESMNENNGNTESGESENDSADNVLPSDDKNDNKENVFFTSEEDAELKESQTSSATQTKGSVGDDGLSIADVAALVKDSVVEITTSETYKNGLVYQSGAGSGVIVKENGIIATNNHVVSGVTDITVRLTNGNTYPAVLIATDIDTDIAILKIEPTETLVAATCGDSSHIVVGDPVIAIGNPLGLLGGTVTNGIISALERELSVDGETMVVLQHNAAVSPGNSGGALFNMRGELIGIVNAKYSSGGAEGLGFAIPVNTFKVVYNDLIRYGYVTGRPAHGLTIDNAYYSSGFYYYKTSELVIYGSEYSSSFKYGDKIISIGGVKPTTVDEAYALLKGYSIGDVVKIVVSRDNKQLAIDLEIVEYKG